MPRRTLPTTGNQSGATCRPAIPESRQTPQAKGVDYFTDASPIAMGGTPAIVFGPGDIAQAHSADEWIDLDQLDQATAIVLRFLQDQP